MESIKDARRQQKERGKKEEKAEKKSSFWPLNLDEFDISSLQVRTIRTYVVLQGYCNQLWLNLIDPHADPAVSSPVGRKLLPTYEGAVYRYV